MMFLSVHTPCASAAVIDTGSGIYMYLAVSIDEAVRIQIIAMVNQPFALHIRTKDGNSGEEGEGKGDLLL